MMEVTNTDLSKAVEKDGEDTEEEEEILVHVEFDCEVDPGMFKPEHTFKIIGIDSENPLMQVGDKVFQGEWRDIIGTSVFFEEDEVRKAEMVHDDPLFSKNQYNPLKLACHTRKSLLMSRVFVKPKNNQQQDKDQLPESTLSDNIEEKTQSATNDSEQNCEQMEVT